MNESIRQLLHERLFERAPIKIAVMDRDYRILEANSTCEGYFGPWKGKRCFELFKGRDAPCGRCMAQKILADGSPRVRSDSLVAGGVTAPFVVRMASLSSQADGGPYLLWMGSKANEASILQQENEVLFERVPCFVTILDRDLRIVRANQRMRATFGPAVGEPCYGVYKRREVPCDSCPALEALGDGHEHTAEQRGLSAAGEETDYVVTAAPLWSEGGEGDRRVDFVVEMSTDVTRFKALEREKLEAERLGAVGQTVAGLAHGIKNILMGLEGGVYVMNSGLRQGQTEKIQRGTEMLARNVSKISNLVKSLLSFSKGHVPKVAETDLNAVAREVLALYRDAAGRVGVGLVGELGEGIAPAPMEAEGIHACLTNLVSNAIDACQMSERPGRTVRISTREEGGALVIQVADDGLGMDCEIKKKIFTTFFTTKGGGGTGLGLLLTRKIVQEHGGKILVDSEPGAGTTFRIVLPRERLPQITAEAEGGSGP